MDMDVDVDVDTAVMCGFWKRHLTRGGHYTRFYSVDSFVFERGGFMRTALPDKPRGVTILAFAQRKLSKPFHLGRS